MNFASLLVPSPIRTETDLYSLSSLLSLRQSPGSLLALNFLTLPEGSLPSLASGQHVDHYTLFFLFSLNNQLLSLLKGAWDLLSGRSKIFQNALLLLRWNLPSIAQNANNVHIFSSLFKNPFYKISRNVSISGVNLPSSATESISSLSIPHGKRLFCREQR